MPDCMYKIVGLGQVIWRIRRSIQPFGYTASAPTSNGPPNLSTLINVRHMIIQLRWPQPPRVWEVWMCGWVDGWMGGCVDDLWLFQGLTCIEQGGNDSPIRWCNDLIHRVVWCFIITLGII